MTTAEVKLAPTTKLGKAPLVHVLAQVRYSPVLTVSRSIPRIQEEFKKAGFPRFEKRETANVVLSSDAAPRIEPVERWDFLSRDKKTGVVLTPAFVVLQTSEYDTFKVFSALFRSVLDIVATEIEVEIVERLGIRYVDLVRIGEGETFADYLKPGLVGFPFADIDADIARTASVTQSIAQLAASPQLPASTLTVKCLQADNGTFLPPDLQPAVLHYDVALEPGETVTILDFDHFAMVDFDFKPEPLLAAFDSLHTVANKAFRTAMQPFAYKKWGGGSA